VTRHGPVRAMVRTIYSTSSQPTVQIVRRRIFAEKKKRMVKFNRVRIVPVGEDRIAG
jgi:hypothetical protein